MAKSESKTGCGPQTLASRNAVEVIADSATEALGGAFLLWILGGVAISIAGSFAGDMIPSLPPGFAGKEGWEGRGAGPFREWWNLARGSAFALFFAIFFAHSLWVGFRRASVGPGRRIQRILSKLRENWFGLIIGNAISAWVAVLVLGSMQNFSSMQILFRPVWEMVLPSLRESGHLLFGESGLAKLGDWFSWYSSNQMKLDFWIIYLGGAFDDLGVPNLKTLGRWAWRRVQRRKKVTAPRAVEEADVA